MQIKIHRDFAIFDFRKSEVEKWRKSPPFMVGDSHFSGFSLSKLGIKNIMRIQNNQQKNRQKAYHIEVSNKPNVDKWFELIGSNNPKHITKYFVWKKYGFCPPHSTLEMRNRFLKDELNPNTFYAGVGERSNAVVSHHADSPLP